MCRSQYPPRYIVNNFLGDTGVGEGRRLYTRQKIREKGKRKKGRAKMKPIIIDHDNPKYREVWRQLGKNHCWNGAFYYSHEIVKNIIPAVKTDRNWVTINIPNLGADHAIVFIHSNTRPDIYDWLKQYEDLILVCGIPETIEKVAHLGKAIYLPLSVDVPYVEIFRIPETDRYINTAFAGRQAKRSGVKLPLGTVFLESMPRPALLERLARCQDVYAVGRTAIEARILGCNILPYDKRFPDPERWKIVDNSEAAVILQKELERIDG